MHASIVAAILWVIAIGVLTLGTTYRDPFGQLKWTDFVHFYTLGHIAQNGPVSSLYNPDALHRRQTELVPESSTEQYLSVYPPQLALLFVPLSNLSYHVAATLWALVNFAVYAISLWLAWRLVRPALPDSALLVAAAAAFPPFWSLVLNGQTTAVPIVAFSAGAIALVHGRKIVAGAALGLLLIKPQFGLMLAVVVLACGEWAMLAGLGLSALVQGVVVTGLLGHRVLLDYVYLLPRIAGMPAALAPRAEQMHSLATVTRVLPYPLSLIAWLIACAWVSWLIVRLWRSGAPVTVRVGALVVGSLLVNPHVYLYDATVIAVPLVWFAGWFEARPSLSDNVRHQWRLAIYALYLLLLFPTARVIGLQLSPFILVWLLYLLRGTGIPSLFKREHRPF
jgi:alpha-1,2-mannosyltransferase